MSTSSTQASESGAAALLAADSVLAQAETFLRSVDDSVYARPSQRLAGGTIGKHFRHSFDHFAAAISAASVSSGAIDYDHRAREVPMETSRAAALDAAHSLRARIEDLRRSAAFSADRDVQVRIMVAADGTEMRVRSTLAREIAFATHHAIHHHAMLKAILAEFGGQAPAGFGMAPSTLNFLKGLAGQENLK